MHGADVVEQSLNIDAAQVIAHLSDKTSELQKALRLAPKSMTNALRGGMKRVSRYDLYEFTHIYTCVCTSMCICIYMYMNVCIYMTNALCGGMKRVYRYNLCVYTYRYMHKHV